MKARIAPGTIARPEPSLFAVTKVTVVTLISELPVVASNASYTDAPIVPVDGLQSNQCYFEGWVVRDGARCVAAQGALGAALRERGRPLPPAAARLV